MQFEFRHVFPCEADVLWEILADSRYQDEANDRAGVDKQILEDRPTAPGQRLVRVRVLPRRTLPPAMARALGTDRLSYVQEQRWRMDTRTMKWVVIPDVLPERVRCKGDFTVGARARGECERVITGELSIGVPLLGGRMEQKAVEDLRASYELTAQVLGEWVRRRGTTAG